MAGALPSKDEASQQQGQCTLALGIKSNTKASGSTSVPAGYSPAVCPILQCPCWPSRPQEPAAAAAAAGCQGCLLLSLRGCSQQLASVAWGWCALGLHQHSTAQHSTAQHSTAQHSTAQHSTAQHSTAQHSTAQHSTAQQTSHQCSGASHKCSGASCKQHSGLGRYATSTTSAPRCNDRLTRLNQSWGLGCRQQQLAPVIVSPLTHLPSHA
jgi:hypothetical protein